MIVVNSNITDRELYGLKTKFTETSTFSVKTCQPGPFCNQFTMDPSQALSKVLHDNEGALLLLQTHATTYKILQLKPVMLQILVC